METDTTVQNAEQDEFRKELPPALQRRVVRQYGGAALIAALTILCMIVMKSWGYTIGFLFAAYVAWLGYDIIRRWGTGQIICKRVVCLEVQRLPLMKNKPVVILKDMNAPQDDERSVKSYYVPTNTKDVAQFSERIILNIYVEAPNGSELLAWQAVDIAPKENG